MVCWQWNDESGKSLNDFRKLGIVQFLGRVAGFMVVVAAEEGRIRNGKGGNALLHVAPVVGPGNAIRVIGEGGGTHREPAQGGKLVGTGTSEVFPVLVDRKAT